MFEVIVFVIGTRVSPLKYGGLFILKTVHAGGEGKGLKSFPLQRGTTLGWFFAFRGTLAEE